MLACLAMWFTFGEEAAWLAFDRQAILAGQVWRLWSGHLVHYSLHHALLDSSVLFLLGMVAERELGARRIGLALLLGAPAISLGLLLATPEMAYYRGASGLATLAAVAGGTALWHSSPKLKALLFAFGAFMAIKIALESLGQPLDMTNLPENVQIAWQAHLLGALLGYLAGARKGIGAHRTSPMMDDSIFNATLLECTQYPKCIN